ncbi:MAG: peptide chain release factor N(5)-glutamine methyltransferase [Pseudomonadota bacterium]
MTRAQALAAAIARLEAAEVPGAARDARLLLRAAAGLGAAQLTPRLGAPIGTSEAQVFEAFIAARCARQPVSQILGERIFWGRAFDITPDVLDPRPETETLIATALDGPTPQRILDLGVGSGALLVTLLAEWPEAQGLGVDISPAALAVAARNAKKLGVGNRAELRPSDWLSAVSGRFDLILCNPPYIGADELAGLAPELRFWEPRAALSPGPDGLCVYRYLSVNLELHLTQSGRALFELGRGQAAGFQEIYLESKGWRVSFVKDMDGVDRCAIVQR